MFKKIGIEVQLYDDNKKLHDLLRQEAIYSIDVLEQAIVKTKESIAIREGKLATLRGGLEDLKAYKKDEIKRLKVYLSKYNSLKEKNKKTIEKIDKHLKAIASQRGADVIPHSQRSFIVTTLGQFKSLLKGSVESSTTWIDTIERDIKGFDMNDDEALKRLTMTAISIEDSVLKVENGTVQRHHQRINDLKALIDAIDSKKLKL